MSLTDDLVLECLVVPDRIVVALAFMVFTIEILDRLVVEQTVRVDATRYLIYCFRYRVIEE
jgi:hypothetical protein